MLLLLLLLLPLLLLLLALQAVGYQHVDSCLLLVRQFGQLQQELQYLQHVTRLPGTCLTLGWT